MLGRLDNHLVSAAAAHGMKRRTLFDSVRVGLDLQGRELVRYDADQPAVIAPRRTHGVNFRRSKGLIAGTKRTLRGVRVVRTRFHGSMLRAQGARRRENYPVPGGNVKS